VRVRDVMDRRPIRIGLQDTLGTAAELFVLTQASDLAVIDGDDRFLGVLSEGDVLRALMPDFAGLDEAEVTLEHAYEIFRTSGADRVGDPINRITIRESITVAPDEELLRPAAVMVDQQIRRLPVVDDGRLVGTISRADICWALLSRVPGGATGLADA